MKKKHHFLLLLLILTIFPSEGQHILPLKISGVYPHLAVYNPGEGLPCAANGNECGIGALVPWAGKLWMITYSA